MKNLKSKVLSLFFSKEEDNNLHASFLPDLHYTSADYDEIFAEIFSLFDGQEIDSYIDFESILMNKKIKEVIKIEISKAKYQILDFDKICLYLNLNQEHILKEKIPIFLIKKLVREVENNLIDLKSKLFYLNSESHLISKNNPFKGDNNLDIFLIEKIFENLIFDPYGSIFKLKKGYETLLVEYYNRVCLEIRIGLIFNVLTNIKLELNRVNVLLLHTKLNFLKKYIDELKSIVTDYPYIENTKEKNVRSRSHNDIKILSNEIRNWFEKSDLNDLFHFLNLDFEKMNKPICLNKDVKSFSLLFFCLLDHIYTKSEIELLFDERYICSYDDKKINIDTYRKHENDFEKNEGISKNRNRRLVYNVLELLKIQSPFKNDLK